MSLFKILRGPSSRISTGTTPFHDGYAYLTPDDGGFYIDAEYNGEQKRIRINPQDEIVSVEATLSASKWSNKTQTISVAGVTADSNGMISMKQSLNAAQVNAAKLADMHISAQSAGSITITAFGEVPTIDIPVVIVLFD